MEDTDPIDSNGLEVMVLDCQVRGPGLKATRLPKVDLVFHSSKINQMSTNNSWEYIG